MKIWLGAGRNGAYVADIVFNPKEVDRRKGHIRDGVLKRQERRWKGYQGLHGVDP
jgi:hypothetical protein